MTKKKNTRKGKTPSKKVAKSSNWPTPPMGDVIKDAAKRGASPKKMSSTIGADTLFNASITQHVKKTKSGIGKKPLRKAKSK